MVKGWAARSWVMARFIPLILTVLALAIIAARQPAEGQSRYDPFQTLQGPARAVSGDVVSVNGRQIRLHGLDAPDPGQTCVNARRQTYDCGQAAQQMLAYLVRGRTFQCTLFSRLTGGQEVGVCQANGHDLGAAMVARGWAYSDRALSNRYEGMEARAQTRRMGVWAGRHQRPWVYRQQQGQDG